MDLQLYQKWHEAGDKEMTLDEVQKMVPSIESKLLCSLNPFIFRCSVSELLKTVSIG